MPELGPDEAVGRGRGLLTGRGRGVGNAAATALAQAQAAAEAIARAQAAEERMTQAAARIAELEATNERVQAMPGAPPVAAYDGSAVGTAAAITIATQATLLERILRYNRQVSTSARQRRRSPLRSRARATARRIVSRTFQARSW